MSFPPDVAPQWSTRSGSLAKQSDRRRRLVVIACLVLVAALTACGSDGDDGASSTTTPQETTTTVDRGGDSDGPDGPDGPDTTVPDEQPSDPDPSTGPDPDRDLTDFEQRYLADLTESMDAMLFPPSVDGGCVARVWVTAIGGDRLDASGLSPEDFVNEGPGALNLDRTTAEAMHRGSLDCGLDSAALVTSAIADDPDSACPVDAISPELFEEAMISAYMGDLDSAAAKQVDDILADCRLPSGP